MEFLHRFVGDLGATMAAGGVVIGRPARALQGAGRRAVAARRAGRAHRHRAALRRGVAARPGRRRLRRVRPGDRPVLAHRGAGVRADRPGRAGLRPRARSSWPSARCARSTRSPRPSAPATGLGWHEHDAGRVHRAASASSGPATSPTCSPSWLPALDGVEDRLRGGRAGRRRRLRARRVDAAHGGRVPGRRRSSGSTTTRPRSRRPSKRAADAGRGQRPASRSRRRGLRRRAVRPGHDLRLPARHGRPAGRGPARAGAADRRTAPG